MNKVLYIRRVLISIYKNNDMTPEEKFKRMQELSKEVREPLIALQEYDLLTKEEHVVIADIFIGAWYRQTTKNK